MQKSGSRSVLQGEEDANSQGDEQHVAESVEEEYSQKHPLQSTWSLWYHSPPKEGTKPSSAEDYSAQFTLVYTFQYVEDFWSVFNHIKPPTLLDTGSAYYIMKEGIRPEWEDPKNIDGGEWMFPFLRKKCNVNDWWMNLAMALIGEFFDDGDIITGACVAVRKSQFRLNVWVGDKTNQDAILRIGRQFKEALNHGSISGNTKQGDLSILLSHADQFTFDFKTFEDQIQGKKNVIHIIRIDDQQ
ncbi:hypothetical protein C9374_007023 [Naegleria lovaniensis]|uniref:Eukaryotic translation initiation factor 4E n=1 Tax=Naegleria lovaniensis TaxID=51637 RepID=A0AA88H6D4_NAELO|nr:uncharacterized protein C9374_007023 [Naegleria lovaniensis]KAG2393492.1 hypothetical protein C9374_007023 [Naegleria lovaniensis]